MKLKSLLLVCGVSLFNNVYAGNIHTHQPSNNLVQAAADKAVMRPSNCQIEIINNSYNDVRVFGIFDDSTTVDFFVYRYDPVQYIDLYYHGYCHPNMFITLQTPYSTIYSNYTDVYSTLTVYPSLAKATMEKVEVKNK